MKDIKLPDEFFNEKIDDFIPLVQDMYRQNVKDVPTPVLLVFFAEIAGYRIDLPMLLKDSDSNTKQTLLFEFGERCWKTYRYAINDGSPIMLLLIGGTQHVHCENDDPRQKTKECQTLKESEAIVVMGLTNDGRASQALLRINQNEDGFITLDLPEKKYYGIDNSANETKSILLEAFYSGFTHARKADKAHKKEAN